MDRLALQEIGEALRYLRMEKGLSQADLADRVGLAQSFYSAVERGKKAGSEETRRRIAEALGWPYTGVLDLAARMERGEDPAVAASKAFSLHDPLVPAPFWAMDLGELEGFRVHVHGEETRGQAWAHRRALEGRDIAKIKAHLVGDQPPVLVLVDHGDVEWSASGLFLVRAEKGKPAVLRQAQMFSGAMLLTGLEGESEATAKAWEKIVLGRVLWYQVNLELAV